MRSFAACQALECTHFRVIFNGRAALVLVVVVVVVLVVVLVMVAFALAFALAVALAFALGAPLMELALRLLLIPWWPAGKGS